MLVLLLLSACGGDDESPGSPGGSVPFDCVGEDLYGPEGGTIEVSKSGSFMDGLRVVVPAGALESCWAIKPATGYAAWPPLGCVGYTRPDDQFSLGMGGGDRYGIAFEFHFPVTGMVIEEGRAPCAFGYDNRTRKWNVLLPDAFDGTTMTVTTTYYDMYMWGWIALDVVSTELLTGAMLEQYGSQTWKEILDGINDAIEVMQTLYVDRSCATWIRVRDVDLPALIDTQRGWLETYQSQIDTCGTCDLFSAEFGLDFTDYIMARIAILAADLWDSYLEGFPGPMPMLDKLEFLVFLQRVCATSFIANMECDYACVWDEAGLGPFSSYALYFAYMVTHMMVDVVIETANPWVSGCP